MEYAKETATKCRSTPNGPTASGWLTVRLRHTSSESSGAMVLRLLEHASELVEAWPHVPRIDGHKIFQAFAEDTIKD